ncbi:hypothetical protein LP419_03300 [Massilia sp. H-1]|nr:hypothetical protein LP419_03300 [Massilia sp. H-1]
MLLAVLHRHALSIAAFDQDVFINAVGGVKITEPSRRSGGVASDKFLHAEQAFAAWSGSLW